MNRLVAIVCFLCFIVSCGENTAPEILHVTQLANADSSDGPYSVLAMVVDDKEVTSVELRYTVGNQKEVWLDMTRVNGDVWRADIPGQPSGTYISYFVVATDSEQPSEEIPIYPPTDDPDYPFNFYVL